MEEEIIEFTEKTSQIEASPLLSVASSPHIKHPDTTRTIMLDVIIAMLPALVWGVFRFGAYALLITVISVISCVLFEGIYQKLMKKTVRIGDLSAVVTGILIAFNLPPSVPVYIPISGAFFAIIIVKQLFGGIGKNIVNPAMAARVFIFLSWSDASTYFPLDGVASATPLTGGLKTGILSELPLVDLFIGNVAGCIGEVSTLLLLAGGAYLMLRKVITWHIPVSFLATVAVITLLFPRNSDALMYMSQQLCSGGLVLGALFMATDYATSPVTKTGRMIFGVGCGLITVFIRYFGGFPEGVSFAILIMNLLVFYIDKLTRPKYFGEKTLIAQRKLKS